MKKEQILSLVRHILSGIGGVLIAKGILNDASTLSIVGSVMSLVAIVWSVMDKTFNVNKIEGTIRQVLTTAGMFVAFITPNFTEEVMGFITGILAIVLGQTAKVKTPQEGAENK